MAKQKEPSFYGLIMMVVERLVAFKWLVTLVVLIVSMIVWFLMANQGGVINDPSLMK